ncbi:MAG: hypothetical protein AAF572_16610 [Cyanobacteria bacterium P01_B01_bin.77]
MHIRKMNIDDISGVAGVHRAAFLHQQMSREWIEENFRAFPQMRLLQASDSTAPILKS